MGYSYQLPVRLYHFLRSPFENNKRRLKDKEIDYSSQLLLPVLLLYVHTNKVGCTSKVVPLPTCFYPFIPRRKGPTQVVHPRATRSY